LAIANHHPPAAPVFCKCTCFTNSTIIPLGPGHSGNNNNDGSNNRPPPAASDDAAGAPTSDQGGAAVEPPGTHLALSARAGSGPSCTQCNHAFCLGYNLPICAGAEDKDVAAMCFQRDRTLDQVIVWSFLLGTAGLLGWAGVRRVVEMRDGRKAGLGLGIRAGVRGGGPAAAGAQRSPGFRRTGAGERDEGARGGYRPVGVDGEGRGGG